MRRRLLRWLIALAAAIVFFWTALTWYVQREAPASGFRIEVLMPPGHRETNPALVLFHPSRDAAFTDDISKAVAEGFAQALLRVEGHSIHEGISSRPRNYSIIAIVANTYNWAPDLPTQHYLKRADLSGQPVIGLIAGAGSTDRAQRIFEEQLRATGARVLAVRPFWLWRPNDESRLNEPNRQVALDMARKMAQQFGQEAAGQAVEDNERKQ